MGRARRSLSLQRRGQSNRHMGEDPSRGEEAKVRPEVSMRSISSR